jgi:hypothetical protein
MSRFYYRAHNSIIAHFDSIIAHFDYIIAHSNALKAKGG